MTGLHISAPGKAVLCGEYAVLRGAPALSMAVNRRARVCLSPSADQYHNFTAPGFANGRWRFRAGADGRVEWLDQPPGRGFRLLEEAFKACVRGELAPISVSVDTGEFFDPQSGDKLGFGSSAAATVALVAGLLRRDKTTADLCAVARSVHRSIQCGRGSGVDVATSCHGGVIRFRSDDVETPVAQAWPAGLEFRFLYSGRSADTLAALGKLDDTSSADEPWRMLVSAAEESSAAWAAGNREDILDSLRRYTKCLSQFSDAYKLGVFSAGHDTMVDLATTVGAVYKPCGAGGGDIGIALASSIDDIEFFCGRAREHGFIPLKVKPDKNGVAKDSGDRDE